jgi:hypothetical protein
MFLRPRGSPSFGDGHCLVHAVSRALVGRELFWHALRVNLMNHLQDNIEKYKELFKDFIDTNEWNDIVEECDPQFCPKDGEPKQNEVCLRIFCRSFQHIKVSVQTVPCS